MHSAGPISVRSSTMSLDVEVLHEGRLLDAFRSLALGAAGMFDITSCRLVRIRGGGVDDLSADALRASCRIRWLSVVLSGMAPGEPSSDDGTGLEDLPLFAPPEPNLGTLFTTPAERELADRSRPRSGRTVVENLPPVIPEPGPPSPADWIQVDGVVLRTGRPICAWIGGSRDCGSLAPTDDEAAALSGPASVRLRIGRKVLRILPGQRFHSATGVVLDPLRQTPERDGREQFLRESSRAALTPGGATR